MFVSPARHSKEDMMRFGKFGLLAAGILIGTYGVKLLKTKEAKKAATAAASLRSMPCRCMARHVRTGATSSPTRRS